jgi:uncharacterized protein YjbI with pentapeptide repeats
MKRTGNRLFDLTGFRGKTLWDFLGLLIVPAVLALGGWWLGNVSTQKQQEIEDQRAQAQQEIEDDRVRQTVLQSYLQDMTTLLLDKGLAKSKLDDPVREIARSSTLAAVRQLDPERKGILLQFLYESNLTGTSTSIEEDGLGRMVITNVDPIIYLFGADLSNANLSGASLWHTNLRGTNLIGANLIDADLSLANLSGADLTAANLGCVDLGEDRPRCANLSEADLSGADLSEANLSGADLSVANLGCADLGEDRPRCANLEGANLSGASLWHANLSGANLTAANLGCADLGEDRPRCADLSEADLSDATGCTNEQLAQAESLVEAIMPDGTIMTEEAWEEFKKRYRK